MSLPPDPDAYRRLHPPRHCHVGRGYPTTVYDVEEISKFITSLPDNLLKPKTRMRLLRYLLALENDE